METDTRRHTVRAYGILSITPYRYFQLAIDSELMFRIELPTGC
jgi:hypothetical protein